MTDRKFFAPREIKLDEAGNVEVAFSQLNVVDKDGDLTIPGAFPSKDVAIGQYGHTIWDGALPVGRGTIAERGDWAVLSGKFFLDTTQGRDTYLTVKAMADLQEWSYGYGVLDKSFEARGGQQVRILKALDVFEVSPVLVGAGVGTHTMSLKAATGVHHTDTTDAAWDGPAMEADCPADRMALRAAHAWVDPEGDPDAKGSYKFIHHMVSMGEVGAASLAACSTGIGYLNRGPGVNGHPLIPEADRQGVWRHLAAHLRDGDMAPPELSGLALGAGASLADSVARFLEDGKALGDQLGSMAGLRAKEGRVLSAANVDRLAAMHERMASVMADLEQLMSASMPPKAADLSALLAVRDRLLREMAAANGVPVTN